MNRPMIFLAALASATLAVTTACFAEAKNTDRPFRADDLHFSLRKADHGGKVRLELSQRQSNHEMTDDLAPAELGLAPAALDRDGAIRLALVREAGRVDCRGDVVARNAEGECRFSADEGFNAALRAEGIARPTLEESYEMTIVGVHRSLIGDLRAARYPTPTVDDLVALSAVGVDGAYIRDLASRHYRPTSLDDLVAFKAVGVSPAYVDGLMKAGLKRTDGETIVAMRALDINPEFIAGFVRIGYPNISPDTLVELKALGVTPEMVQAVQRDRSNLPLPQRHAARALIESKAP